MLPIESPTLTHAIARSNRSGSQAGFTRPDLVATSALIAALLMLGVRTHSDAAQNARWALCQDHQSALLKSWHAYSDDRKGSLPGNTDDGNTLGSNWVGGTVTDPLMASDASVLTNRSRAALGGYVSDPAVFRCPADTSTVQARGARTPRNRSYAMNCAVGTSSDGVRPTDGAWLDNAHGHTANSVWRTFGRMSDIVQAPSTDYMKGVIAQIPRIWISTESPAVSARSADEPVMSVRDVKRTYLVRRPGHFNSYNEVQAVRGITFDVMARDNIGIVGESGCGKSTLTRLLAALETPEQGEIMFQGKALTTSGGRALKESRRHFQLLLQDPYNSLPPRMTVGRMIEEGVRIHGLASGSDLRARVRRGMEDVGLPPDLYDALPNSLSTGDRQRISVARALVLEPKLLILDETVSALDQAEQNKLLALFSRLQQEKDLTYIFISHDLAMVRRVCTRIAVMYLGEIVEIADNRNLFYSARHPYTKALLSAIPTIEDNPYDSSKLLLEGEPPSPINIAPGCSFASRCPFAMKVCREKAPAITAVSPSAAVACHLFDGTDDGAMAGAAMPPAGSVLN